MGKQKKSKAKKLPTGKPKAAHSALGVAVPEMVTPSPLADPKASKKKRNKFYERELRRLHIELVKLQE